MKRGIVVVLLLWSGCIFSSADPTGSRSDMGTDAGNISDLSIGDATQADGAGDTCGDGALQANETCDPMLPADSPGACPTECDDGEACTEDILVGSADTCDAACSVRVIEMCRNNDGCCPSDCTAAEDSDCDDNAACGDGMLSASETCDPGITSGDGVCPVIDSCEPGVCEVPRVIGSRTTCDAECSGVAITLCNNGDGCCAPGCDSTNDDDCVPGCGNGIIDPGERCDGNCPTACDDNNPCTNDMLVGAPGTCDAECVHTPIDICVNGDMCCPAGCSNANDGDCSATCGNDMIDAGETCDENTATPCPTSCDDSNACTRDTSTGSPSNCNVVCNNEPVTACIDDDGCCPSTCNANNDSDCSPSCGNMVTEQGESCDGNCPTNCDDGAACTIDSLTGSAGNCSARCEYENINSCNSGDGCCPNACNANNDSDCGAICGNGVTEPGEACDGNCPASCNDGNACTTDVRSGSSANCNVTCTYTNVTACISNDGCCPSNCTANNDSDCSASCGNGVIETGETCDGNCPTSAQCTQMYGACAQRTGNASSCNVVCSQEPNCTPCSLNDPQGCNCPDPGQICDGGKCQTSSGNDCEAACDPNAYCGVHGPGETCSQFGTCVDCTMNTDCAYNETCSNNLCVPTTDCGIAGNPDQYCATLGFDGCDLNANGGLGQCRNDCQVNTDCNPLQTCSGGWCVPASHCGEAADPDAFCPLDFVCVGMDCRRSCDPQFLNCQCLNKSTQSCVGNNPSYCADQQPTHCTQVCMGFRDQYCVDRHGTGWLCKGQEGGIDGCTLGGVVDM